MNIALTLLKLSIAPEIYNNFQSFTMHGREVPILKMLKRQVSNFRSGLTASVTLVFQSSQPVVIRWFRLAPNLNMESAEVPNMLPVEGIVNELLH